MDGGAPRVWSLSPAWSQLFFARGSSLPGWPFITPEWLGACGGELPRQPRRLGAGNGAQVRRLFRMLPTRRAMVLLDSFHTYMWLGKRSDSSACRGMFIPPPPAGFSSRLTAPIPSHPSPIAVAEPIPFPSLPASAAGWDNSRGGGGACLPVCLSPASRCAVCGVVALTLHFFISLPPLLAWPGRPSPKARLHASCKEISATTGTVC